MYFSGFMYKRNCAYTSENFSHHLFKLLWIGILAEWEEWEDCK